MGTVLVLFPLYSVHSYPINLLNMSGKMLVVLLAVCLVSAQAFVKRETATGGESNYLETIQKQIQTLSTDLNSKLSEAFKPEKIQEDFGKALDSLQKALTELKEKTTKKE